MLNLEPKAAIGFSVARGLSDTALLRWNRVHEKVLGLFPWLQITEIEVGATIVRLWSHFSPNASMYKTNSGETLILAGSPFGRHSWDEVTMQLARRDPREFVLPWEGRCVLLRVSSNGEEWDLWNDWAASVPVFYASWGQGGVASTLEPVVVESAGLNSTQFSKRGLVELLLLGHLLDTDTLYEPMHVLPPDSYALWQHGKIADIQRLWTVQASDSHYSVDRSALLEEMHALTIRAISESLTSEHEPVLLPLSSGMDSRLIACVAADLGVWIEAYSYGEKTWAEALWASQVAKTLGIPWQRVALGVDFNANFIRPWLDWFGSSQHAHGMYQFPLLKCIEGRGGLVPHGFYGNNMGGGNHPNDCMFQQDKGLLDRYLGYITFWDQESLIQLLDFDPRPYYIEMDALLQNQVSLVSDWDEYQQMNAIDMWNRQARMIFYQPEMYSYFGLERSPYMHRDYARFCMSLPPALLWKRKLQLEMLARYWPHVSQIGGSFRDRQGLDRRWHSVRSLVAMRLPRSVRPLTGITESNMSHVDCATARRWDNFFPVSHDLSDLGPLRARPILDAAERAMSGNLVDLKCIVGVIAAQPHRLRNVLVEDPRLKNIIKLMAVQPVVFRLLNEKR